MGIDVSSNRKAIKYSSNEILRRLLWGIVLPLFSWSPRPCFAWRRWLLRIMGAKIGRNVHIYPSAEIYFPWMLNIGDHAAIGEGAYIYNLGPITIGERATISHRAHLCAGTHDYTDPKMPLMKLPILIAEDAWICSEAFVGPGVTVGVGAVVGARAVATKDVPPWAIVAGNPAKVIKQRVLIREPSLL